MCLPTALVTRDAWAIRCLAFLASADAATRPTGRAFSRHQPGRRPIPLRLAGVAPHGIARQAASLRHRRRPNVAGQTRSLAELDEPLPGTDSKIRRGDMEKLLAQAGRRKFLKLLIAYAVIFTAVQPVQAKKHDTATRVAFLVNELSTTVERQQTALDEIVRGGNDITPFLFKYMNNPRKLATQNVKFLNAEQRPVEQYFLTKSSTVDELIIRYLCWKTIHCDPWFAGRDKTSKDKQYNALVKLCDARFKSKKISCTGSRGK